MLVLVRGLPGSGKSTFAATLGSPISADDFFTSSAGEYNFNPSLLPQAHAECLRRALESLARGGVTVVANTFSQRWEMEPYLTSAPRVTVVDLFDAGLTDEELAARCVHGVPPQTIAAMRARWEHSWGLGDPRAPWLR